MDVFATALDLAGISPPNALDGESLVPLLRGAAPAANRSLFHCCSGKLVAARRGDYKLKFWLEALPPETWYADRSARTVRRRARARRAARRAASSQSIFEADPTLAERPQSSVMSPLASVRMGRTEPSVFAEFSELSEKHHSVNLGQVALRRALPDAPKIAADLMGATTIGVPLRTDWAETSADWRLDLDELDGALTDRTKLLVLNTPHNPTGKVFSKSELEGIATVVKKYPKLIVLTDEVYEDMVFDGLEHVHIASLPGMFERTISVFSAGKAFSATGWRVGHAIGPEELISPLVRVHQASNFSTPTPLQIATAIAFERGAQEGYFAEFSATLQAKRDKLCRLLRTAGLSPIVPQGGYFLLADTTKVGGVTTEFPLWEAPEDMPLRDRRDFAVCRLLCERAGVTAIPASAFFSLGHRHITDSLARFCFCKEDKTLDEACKRIVHSGLNATWV
ncbi:transferase [Aureococcus anophagefferens]|nr:transferase [Aureococcus anophagefferens]